MPESTCSICGDRTDGRWDYCEQCLSNVEQQYEYEEEEEEPPLHLRIGHQEDG